MTVNLLQLKAEHVASWWPKIEHFAEAIASTMRGKYDAEDLFSCACKGTLQFWLGVEGLGVKALGITTINDFPSTRICQFIAVTGEDREEWQTWMKEVEDWAYFNGCTDMELVCRPGWERVMKNYGFNKTHVVLNKYLTEKEHGRK